MDTNAISRVAYFSGEALLTDDFRDEQRYHKQMREQLSQGVFTAGVMEGLDVEWTFGQAQLTVRAGKALDSAGRLIVLTQDASYPGASPVGAFIDGSQNYLIISYAQALDQYVSNTYGDGYKRWVEQPQIACVQDYDPDDADVLLAVISVSGGAIQSVYYNYGQYMRRHVGAVLQSVAFVDGSDMSPDPAPMAVAATAPGRLSIKAPQIDLDGAVTAQMLTANGTFTGNFNGSFVGDGSGLTLPSSNYWTRDGNGLYYEEGNVCIGDADTSGAHLTIRQGNVGPKVATGLISLQDDGTVVGYQTQFLSEVKVGQVLTYDYVPAQTATIANVISTTEVEIDARFAIDLGPAPYAIRHANDAAVAGPGLVYASGTTVTCEGGTFPQGLLPGDKLVIDASTENSQKTLRVQQVISDTQLKVVGMSPGTATGNGPKLSAFSVTPSVLLAAGGVHPADANLPEALSVAQNGGGARVPNSVGVNVEGGALSGNNALEVRGACSISRWPVDPTNAAPLLTVGATAAEPLRGLSVTDNGSAASVPRTVSINVDTIDAQYALDVSGPCRVSSLEVTSAGSLKAASEIDADKIGPYTPDGSIEVTSDLVIDKTIKGSGANALKVAGDLEVTGNETVDGTLNVTGPLNVTGGISGKLQNPIPGPLTINGAFQVTGGSTTADGDLFVHGNLHVNGALSTDAMSVKKIGALADQVFEVTDDGDLNMAGTLAIGSAGNRNFLVSPGGEVTINSSGKLSVGGGFMVAPDGPLRCFGRAVTRKKRIQLDASDFLQGTAVTDGYIVVDVNADDTQFGAAEIIATVSPAEGDSYALRAAAIVGTTLGRGGAGTTVPIATGSTCTFDARTTSGKPVYADVSITWIPLGSGGFTNLESWGS
ncbi:hypothetical protein WKR88_26020 [Trinickia caryophylli]|uniref:Uncharacterized protein n=1 Tax=Trinickia caryophylli TaxID=28094 RepID=A0A1X7GAP0_TRICW|nr:hypothetical protein [Trinickia caryophylli]PMS11350.1 hypothetical protein C0Z17_14480 [Trinickia caryophylli]TRX17543.1 hypothetical protein FNF07_04400 [Trinickia caryophylli]WQE11710.1 hypothetical protein U0034_18520 [Trinickia caryophylli]SMF66704.1 hypothetical protein SAMN06295900_114143 [Trinickia caryophylli]GLU34895.1 hypothetical protein Busp01_47370 [Trinickia caryophylli]